MLPILKAFLFCYVWETVYLKFSNQIVELWLGILPDRWRQTPPPKSIKTSMHCCSNCHEAATFAKHKIQAQHYRPLIWCHCYTYHHPNKVCFYQVRFLHHTGALQHLFLVTVYKELALAFKLWIRYVDNFFGYYKRTRCDQKLINFLFVLGSIDRLNGWSGTQFCRQSGHCKVFHIFLRFTKLLIIKILLSYWVLLPYHAFLEESSSKLWITKWV